MNYKHIIWDWNGTLLNDVHLCTNIINTMLTARGKKALSVTDYKTVFTFPVEEYYKTAGFDFTTENFDTVGHEFIDAYNLRVAEAKLFADAREILENFHRKSISQSILSARKHDFLLLDIQKFELSSFFNHISGIDNHLAAGKTEIGKLLIEKSNIAQKHTLLIGDTLHDAQVAAHLNIDCVLVADGHQSEQRLKTQKNPVFNNLKELIVFFEK